MVMVDPASNRPESAGGVPSSLSCSKAEFPAPFPSKYCLVECIDFLGHTPTQAELDELDVDVFVGVTELGTETGVDPTYSSTTGRDRSPAERQPVSFNVRPSPNDCDGGYQMELGFTAGPGTQPGDVRLDSGTVYIVRVRSATTSSAAAAGPWATVYHQNQVRRFDQTPGHTCTLDEARTPSRDFVFPVVHSSILEEAIAGAGTTVPGSSDLNDQLGTGYLLAESHDCSGAPGVRARNVTFGANPNPLAVVYPGDNYDLNRDDLYTSNVALWFGVGFPGFTDTSSLAQDVVTAAGVGPDGCTEAFGGVAARVYPDAVTFVRFNRETSF